MSREQSPIKLGEVELSTYLLTTLHQPHPEIQHRSEMGLGAGLSYISLIQVIRVWPSLPSPLFPKPSKEPDPKRSGKGP